MKMGLTQLVAFSLCIFMLLMESSAHDEVNFSNMLDIKIVSGEIGVVDWYHTERLAFDKYAQGLHWFRFIEDERVVSLYERYCSGYNLPQLATLSSYSRVMSWFRPAVAKPTHSENIFLHATCEIATYVKGLSFDGVKKSMESEYDARSLFAWVADLRSTLSGTLVEPLVGEPEKNSYRDYIIQKMDPRQWTMKDCIKLCIMLLMTVVFTKAFNAFILPQVNLLWYTVCIRPKIIQLRHARWAAEGAEKAAEKAKFEAEKQAFYEQYCTKTKPQASYEVMACMAQLKQDNAHYQNEISVLEKELTVFRSCMVVKELRILEAETGFKLDRAITY